MKRAQKGSEEIFGMARVGYIGVSKELEVYINTNDNGIIPHFHLRDSANGEKFHTCIKIASPEYYPHDGKEDRLNSSMIKALDTFMRSKVQIERYADKFDNNWQLTCFLWELNNSDTDIPTDVAMPDYQKIRQREVST